MKKSLKYWMIIAMVMFGAILLVSGNASAVIVAPQPGITVIGSAPMVSPVFGSGIAPGVALAPKSAGVAVVHPFFPVFRPFGFPFFGFNPFFDIDPVFGFGFNEGFVD